MTFSGMQTLTVYCRLLQWVWAVRLPSTLVGFEALELATLLAHTVFASVNSTEQVRVRPRTQLSLRNLNVTKNSQ